MQPAVQELVDLLQQQVSSAKAGNLGSVDAATPRVQKLLGTIGTLEKPKDDLSLLKKIEQLHAELCLVVAAQKRDLAREMARTGHGRSSLAAYKSAQLRP